MPANFAYQSPQQPYSFMVRPEPNMFYPGAPSLAPASGGPPPFSTGPAARGTATAPAIAQTPSGAPSSAGGSSNLLEDIAEFINHPITQMVGGALSSVLMLPGMPGGAWGTGAGMRGGAQALMGAQKFSADMGHDRTRADYMAAQASSMRRPFQKPEYPLRDDWTDESYQLWQDTRTATNPLGNMGILVPRPPDAPVLHPLEEEYKKARNELTQTRVRALKTAQKVDASTPIRELKNSLKVLLSLRDNYDYWQNLTPDERQMMMDAMKNLTLQINERVQKQTGTKGAKKKDATDPLGIRPKSTP